MNNFTTIIAQAIANGDDLKEIFRKQVEKALNMLLKAEQSAFLGYDPWEPKGYNIGNSRNGYYKRKLKTELGELDIEVPRDRLGHFQQQTLGAYLQEQDQLEQSIILLYRNGISTREVSELIERMYGHHYSAQTISTMSHVVKDEVKAFHKRQVKNRYTAIFCDATFINVRRDTVAKEALHVIIGIDEKGFKEVLSFALYPTEAATNYREMLEDLKERGLEEVLLFVSDELTGLSQAVTDSFPKAKHQSCWTHLLRNTSNKVRPKDKGEVLEDLKHVYRAKDQEESELKLQAFVKKWERTYPKVTKGYQSKDNLFTFMNFPECVRPSLYTNNISENFNKQLKRKTKVKEQFPNEESLEKAVYCYVSEFNVRFTSRSHKGFKMAQFQIAQLFEKVYGEDNKDTNHSQKFSSPSGDERGLRIVS